MTRRLQLNIWVKGALCVFTILGLLASEALAERLLSGALTTVRPSAYAPLNRDVDGSGCCGGGPAPTTQLDNFAAEYEISGSFSQGNLSIGEATNKDEDSDLDPLKEKILSQKYVAANPIGQAFADALIFALNGLIDGDIDNDDVYADTLESCEGFGVEDLDTNCLPELNAIGDLIISGLNDGSTVPRTSVLKVNFQDEFYGFIASLYLNIPGVAANLNNFEGEFGTNVPLAGEL